MRRTNPVISAIGVALLAILIFTLNQCERMATNDRYDREIQQTISAELTKIKYIRGEFNPLLTMIAPTGTPEAR